MKDELLARLFVRFRDRRDGKALAAVFDATARDLLGVAAHLVPTADAAEDVVQTTFQRMIERAASFDASRSLLAWAYGILWREAAKLRREEARRIDPVRLAQPTTLDPADLVAAEELPQLLTRALQSLPSPYREVVEPVLREQRSTRELARELGRSPGTVRVQLQRGLERMRKSLPRGAAPGMAMWAGSVGREGLRSRVLAQAGFVGSEAPKASIASLVLQLALAGFATAPFLLPGVVVLSLGTLAWIFGAFAGRPTSATDELVRSDRLTTAPVARPESNSASASVGLVGTTNQEARRTVASAGEVTADESWNPATLDVWVTERDGSPIVDRGIWLRGGPELEDPWLSETTNAEGRARFAELVPGSYTVRPKSGDPGVASFELQISGGEQLEIVLLPGDATLRGTIRCARRPLEAGIVWTRSIRGAPPLDALGRLSSHGNYEIRGLVPGAYELLVQSQEGEQYNGLVWMAEVAVEWHTRRDVELPAGRIEGVVKGISLKPQRRAGSLGQVHVFAHDSGPIPGNRGLWLDPDPAGRFNARHLPPGDYTVSLDPRATDVPFPVKLVSLSAGSPGGMVQHVELSPLVHMGHVSGRLLGVPEHGRDSGLGEPQASLWLHDTRGLVRVGYADFGEGGRFSFAPVEPGEYSLLIGSMHGGSTPFFERGGLEVVDGLPTEVQLECPASRPVTIRLDSRGVWAPVANWRLRLPSGQWFPYHVFVGSNAKRREAPPGTFELAEGHYTVEANFGDPTPVLREFDLAPGEDRLEIVIERP